jgi:hypothetical protein
MQQEYVNMVLGSQQHSIFQGKNQEALEYREKASHKQALQGAALNSCRKEYFTKETATFSLERLSIIVNL